MNETAREALKRGLRRYQDDGLITGSEVGPIDTLHNKNKDYLMMDEEE